MSYVDFIEDKIKPGQVWPGYDYWEVLFDVVNENRHANGHEFFDAMKTNGLIDDSGLLYKCRRSNWVCESVYVVDGDFDYQRLNMGESVRRGMQVIERRFLKHGRMSRKFFIQLRRMAAILYRHVVVFEEGLESSCGRAMLYGEDRSYEFASVLMAVRSASESSLDSLVGDSIDIMKAHVSMLYYGNDRQTRLDIIKTQTDEISNIMEGDHSDGKTVMAAVGRQFDMLVADIIRTYGKERTLADLGLKNESTASELGLRYDESKRKYIGTLDS